MNSQQQTSPDGEFFGSGLGYLVVRVTTARGAVPIEGATVQVRENILGATDIILTAKTDASGITERIPLPAPSMTDLTGPTCVRPYYPYMIDVLAEGYHPQTYIDVSIYDGVTSYQSADLVPLSEPRTGSEIQRGNPQVFGQDRERTAPPSRQVPTEQPQSPGTEEQQPGFEETPATEEQTLPAEEFPAEPESTGSPDETEPLPQ